MKMIRGQENIVATLRIFLDYYRFFDMIAIVVYSPVKVFTSVIENTLRDIKYQ